MRLTELKPRFIASVRAYRLEFDCPVCRTHQIEIPIRGDKAWKWDGNENLDTMTITPSIAHECYDADKRHFFITNGEIRLC